MKPTPAPHPLLVRFPHLSDHWYPLAPVERLRPGQPQRRWFFGQPLAVFALPGGGAAALRDACPHRLAPLSAGRVTAAGCLQCPYHGWRFDAAGCRVAVPGLPSAGVDLAEVRVPAWRLERREGWWWATPGQPRLPPPPARPAGTEGHARFFLESEGRFALVDGLENLLDATHTHFVHAGLIRTEGARRPVRVVVRRGPDRVEAEYFGEGRASGWLGRLFEGSRTTSLGRFVLPTTAELAYHDRGGPRFFLRADFVPTRGEEDWRVAVTVWVRRPRWFPAPAAAWVLGPFLRAALRQDRRMLDRQRENRACFPDLPPRSTRLDLLRPHLELLLREGGAARWEGETGIAL